MMQAAVYPPGAIYDAPLVIVGKILGIIMLILTFIMLIPGLSSLYLMI